MIVIIDYGLGNLLSVANALRAIEVDAIISHKEEDIIKADKLILPGVGAFSNGMRNLKSRGLIKILNNEVFENKKPILGICLGIQLFAEMSHERGIHEGLGWISNSSVDRIIPSDPSLKVPHVGWDVVKYKKNSLFEGLQMNPEFYFVHSFYVNCSEDIITSTFDYGGTFTASIMKENIYGTQFHPEKSQKNGLKMLKNFSEL
ncbi:hypothetical protein LCGC14_0985680 [marine sediment metagenome]|uniref:Glutamine amidotransferase domain-containing protein n=1 Tax=marine sediment metagenome TaxID=412755 RepID=A0A0F9RDY6_9ZZZZ|nr:imidazole glycerol phosphate synthase subunit HisH [archaeon]